MKNATVSQAVKYATLGGSAIIIMGAAKQLMSQPLTLKGAFMPVVSVLVGVAAFNYAMKQTTVVVEKKG